MPRIIVTIDPEGKATVKAEGYRGKSCADATKAIREAIGAQETEKKTAEWYQTTSAEQRQQARG